MTAKRKREPVEMGPDLGEVNPPPDPAARYTGPLMGELVGNRLGEGTLIRKPGEAPKGRRSLHHRPRHEGPGPAPHTEGWKKAA